MEVRRNTLTAIVAFLILFSVANAAEKREPLKPTLANVPYGSHPRQVLDFYRAESKTPTPLVLFIHGGGWGALSKENVHKMLDVPRLLMAGISVAAINYRYVHQAQAAAVQPPVKWPLEDAARALQFVRSKAAEWNIDKVRIGANGGSAGACSSLWLALHGDMAISTSPDPIARESTRLWCAAVVGAQTSLDPHAMRQWMPNSAYGGHAFGFRTDGKDKAAEFQRFYEARNTVLPWIKEYSPIEHASQDDPPLWLSYSQNKPVVKGEDQQDPTHSALFGLMLEERTKPLGVELIVTYPAKPAGAYRSATDYLIARLKTAVPVQTEGDARWNELIGPRNLTRWRDPRGDWMLVGSVMVNPLEPNRLAWQPGSRVAINGPKGKSMNLVSADEFADVEAHIEFMIPAKSNSGVYFMGRYELQVYDSFGVTQDKYPGIECGGIYPRWIDGQNVGGNSPRVNASLPAGQWQAFDVIFRAPQFDAAGMKIRNAAFVKVVHNGKLIHENVEVPGPTRSGLYDDEQPSGPLMLQGDHGPVAYRNVRIRRPR